MFEGGVCEGGGDRAVGDERASRGTACTRYCEGLGEACGPGLGR